MTIIPYECTCIVRGPRLPQLDDFFLIITSLNVLQCIYVRRQWYHYNDTAGFKNNTTMSHFDHDIF